MLREHVEWTQTGARVAPWRGAGPLSYEMVTRGVWLTTSHGNAGARGAFASGVRIVRLRRAILWAVLVARLAAACGRGTCTLRRRGCVRTAVIRAGERVWRRCAPPSRSTMLVARVFLPVWKEWHEHRVTHRIFVVRAGGCEGGGGRGLGCGCGDTGGWRRRPVESAVSATPGLVYGRRVSQLLLACCAK